MIFSGLLDCRLVSLKWRVPCFLITKRVLVAAVISSTAIVTFVSPSYAEITPSRRLLEVMDFGAPVVSPAGTSVAFRVEQASIERNTYDTVWYVQDMDGKRPPRRVADGGIPLRDSAGVSLPAPAMWSTDERWIYYRAMMDGRIDVWRAATDGSGAEPLTLDPADVRGFSLSADGKVLRYSVGATREEVVAAEQAEYDHGIRIDRTVPVGQNLFRSGAIEGRLATQRHILTSYGRDSLLADFPDHWKAVDLDTRKVRDLPSSEAPSHSPKVSELAKQGLPEPWRMAIDDNTGRIALLTRVGNGAGLLEKPDVQMSMLPRTGASQAITCQAELCTGKAISGIQWRPDSDEVLFTVTDPHEGAAQSIFRWNVRTGAVHLVVSSGGLISGGRDRFSSCGLSSDALACVTAEADQPPRLERIDLEAGQRRIMFEPNEALAQDIAATAPARLLRWTDAKGVEFTGRLFAARRTDDTPPPLFITYYSCTGFLRGNVGDEWPLATLAGHGVSALCINSAPYRLDAVERYDLGLSAVASVIELLSSSGEIDPARVGMGGLSFGSEVTYWTLIQSDLLVAASVASAPVTPISYLFRSLAGDPYVANRKEYWQLGALDETPDRWQELSPGLNLGKMQAAMLMQMSEQEYLFSLDYAIPLIRDYRADLYVFVDEPHQKFQPKHKLAVYERNLDWFRFWLLGYEDPDPAKNQQYSIWRAMRDRTLGRRG